MWGLVNSKICINLKLLDVIYHGFEIQKGLYKYLDTSKWYCLVVFKIFSRVTHELSGIFFKSNQCNCDCQ